MIENSFFSRRDALRPGEQDKPTSICAGYFSSPGDRTVWLPAVLDVTLRPGTRRRTLTKKHFDSDSFQLLLGLLNGIT
jgi:hypothetical protein